MLLSACLYCRGTALSPAYERCDGRVIVRCAGCGLQFITDVPDDLEKLYEADYFDKNEAASGQNSGYGYENYSECTTMQFRWQLALLRLFEGERAHRGARLLDLGCATGRFLQMASLAGFQTSGMELSAAATQVARDQGFLVEQEAIERAQPETADVATAWDVVEHVLDLRGIFEKIRGILRDGGSFFFSTPDGGAPRAQVEGARWSCLTSSLEHITYLTRPFLERALRETFGAEPLLISFDVGGEWTNIIGFVRVGGLSPRDRRIGELLARRAIPESESELRALGAELAWFYNTFDQSEALDLLVNRCRGVLPPAAQAAIEGGWHYKAGRFTEAIPLLHKAAAQEPLSLTWLVDSIERSSAERIHGLEVKLDAKTQEADAERSRFAQTEARYQSRQAELEHEVAHLRGTLDQILHSLTWKIGRGITSTIERIPYSAEALDGLRQIRSRGRWSS